MYKVPSSIMIAIILQHYHFSEGGKFVGQCVIIFSVLRCYTSYVVQNIYKHFFQGCASLGLSYVESKWIRMRLKCVFH